MPGDFNAANAAMARDGVGGRGRPVVDSVARMNAVAERRGPLRATSVEGPNDCASCSPRTRRGSRRSCPSSSPSRPSLWIAINDQVADGRDPSWLYDVPFEVLAGRAVTCLGSRRLDLAARLDYAGCATSR